MKNGKAWGCVYEDGHSISYGWMDPDSAPIHDPQFYRKPTDVTHGRSHYTAELSTAQLVAVERTTTVTILPNVQRSETPARRRSL